MTHTIKFFVSILLISTLAISTAAAPRAVLGDYFGAGRTNYVQLSLTQEGQIVWDILRNPVTNPPQTRRTFWGRADPQTGEGDVPLAGDWDGDLKIDVAVWRPGNAANSQSWFYIQPSSNSNPNAILAVPWGKSNNFPNDTDFPATGDYDGDGKDDFAVTRRENGQTVWYILPSGGGNFRRIVFGLANDGALNGSLGGADFNGDGRDDLIIVRFDNAGKMTWYVGDASTGNLILVQEWGNFGFATGAGMGYGNYIGDSRADIVVVYADCYAANPNCGVAGTWWIKETGSNNYTVTRFGIPSTKTSNGDFPDFGDYDGDGKFDISVFREPDRTYYHLLSSNGQVVAQRWDGISAFPLENGLGDSAAPLERKIPLGLFQTMFVNRDANGAFTAERRFFKFEK